MEQFPQRESVPQVGVFHTPRLRNDTTPLTGTPICRVFRLVVWIPLSMK